MSARCSSSATPARCQALLEAGLAGRLQQLDRRERRARPVVQDAQDRARGQVRQALLEHRHRLRRRAGSSRPRTTGAGGAGRRARRAARAAPRPSRRSTPRSRLPGVVARHVAVVAGDQLVLLRAAAEQVVEADGDERPRRRVAPLAGGGLAQAGAAQRGDERPPLDGVLARQAVVGVEGEAVQRALVAGGDLRRDAVRLEHDQPVAGDVRRPAREVGGEVGLDVGGIERVAGLGEVGAARQPGRRGGRVRAAVAAVVVDERVHVQALVDRRARGRRGRRAARRDPRRRRAGRATARRPARACARARCTRGVAEVGADHQQRVLVEVAPAQRARRARARGCAPASSRRRSPCRARSAAGRPAARGRRPRRSRGRRRRSSGRGRRCWRGCSARAGRATRGRRRARCARR